MTAIDGLNNWLIRQGVFSKRWIYKEGPPSRSGLVFDRQKHRWVKPMEHSLQSKFKQKMIQYQEEHEQRIKEINNKFMSGKMSLQEMDAAHDKENKRIDDIADIVRVKTLQDEGIPVKNIQDVKDYLSGRETEK